MNTEELFTKVVQIIKPFSKNTAALTSAGPTTRILEDLGVNSARLVDIILAFEDEFAIEVDDAAADSVRTMGDAVKMIHAKLAH